MKVNNWSEAELITYAVQTLLGSRSWTSFSPLEIEADGVKYSITKKGNARDGTATEYVLRKNGKTMMTSSYADTITDYLVENHVASPDVIQKLQAGDDEDDEQDYYDDGDYDDSQNNIVPGSLEPR